MLTRNEGFTLIELIAVMVIMSILASAAAVKFIDFDRNASDNMIDLAIDELNTREKLTWANVKLENIINVKTEVWNRMQNRLEIGPEATVTLTQITVGGASASVKREHKKPKAQPAMWSRK